jgi:hypothetical protein
MKKIEQFDLALRLAGFNFKKQAVELIINLYELTKQKGGDATLDEVTKIISDNDHKYEDKT